MKDDSFRGVHFNEINGLLDGTAVGANHIYIGGGAVLCFKVSNKEVDLPDEDLGRVVLEEAALVVKGASVQLDDTNMENLNQWMKSSDMEDVRKEWKLRNKNRGLCRTFRDAIVKLNRFLDGSSVGDIRRRSLVFQSFENRGGLAQRGSCEPWFRASTSGHNGSITEAGGVAFHTRTMKNIKVMTT